MTLSTHLHKYHKTEVQRGSENETDIQHSPNYKSLETQSNQTKPELNPAEKHNIEVLRYDDRDASLEISTVDEDRDIAQYFENEISEDEYESETLSCNYCDEEFKESKPLFEHLIEKHDACKMCYGYGFTQGGCYECGASRS